MPDQNEILRRLSAQTGNPQLASQLRAALDTPDGRRTAQVISAQHADELERALQAAQRGDLQEVTRLAQQLAQTSQGTALAAQLQKMFRQQGGASNGQ